MDLPETERTITLDEITAFNEEKDKTGIVYISRIPPMMGPQEIRNYLSPFGEITRVYLTPVDKTFGRAKKSAPQQKKRGMFIDGWIEFRSKKSAKNAALALNGTTVGGKRTSKYFGELWSIKYLSKFKWQHLTEQIAHEKAVRDQKMQAEISQAKREASFYLKQAEKAETIAKIEAKRAAKRLNEESSTDQAAVLESIRKRFRQRKPISNKSE